MDSGTGLWLPWGPQRKQGEQHEIKFKRRNRQSGVTNLPSYHSGVWAQVNLTHSLLQQQNNLQIPRKIPKAQEIIRRD